MELNNNMHEYPSSIRNSLVNTCVCVQYSTPFLLVFSTTMVLFWEFIHSHTTSSCFVAILRQYYMILHIQWKMPPQPTKFSNEIYKFSIQIAK